VIRMDDIVFVSILLLLAFGGFTKISIGIATFPIICSVFMGFHPLYVSYGIIIIIVAIYRRKQIDHKGQLRQNIEQLLQIIENDNLSVGNTLQEFGVRKWDDQFVVEAKRVARDVSLPLLEKESQLRKIFEDLQKVKTRLQSIFVKIKDFNDFFLELERKASALMLSETLEIIREGHICLTGEKMKESLSLFNEAEINFLFGSATIKQKIAMEQIERAQQDFYDFKQTKKRKSEDRQQKKGFSTLEEALRFLGLQGDIVTQELVDNAVRELMLKCHPRFGKEGDPGIIQKIREAREFILKKMRDSKTGSQ